MEYADLTRVMKTCKNFISWLYSAFALHSLALGCCVSMCCKSHTSTCRFLLFLSCIVEHVKDSRCCHEIVMWKSQKTTQDDSKEILKSVNFIGWDGRFYLKRTKTRAWPLTWLFYPLSAYVFDLFTLIRVCCACKEGHCRLITSLQLSVLPFITSYSHATAHTLCTQQYLSAIGLKILFDHIQDLLCFDLKCFEIWKPGTHVCVRHTSPFDNDTRKE